MLHSAAGLPEDTKKAVVELQGIRLAAVVGAAAGTKMNVPGMQSEDTILSLTDYPSTITDDAPNATASAAKASGTLTVAAAANGDTFVVNGNTFTMKTTPTNAQEVKVTVGDNTVMAAAIAAAINSYENRRLSTGNPNTPAVVATSALAIVTVTALAEGAGNGPVVTEGGAEITLVATDPGAIAATCIVAINDTTTLTVNGIVFTAKTTPTDLDLHFRIKTTAADQATEINRIINAYQTKTGRLGASATVAAAVVTIRASAARAGNSITLTGTAVRLAASGAGYLAGGSNTGGFTSLTNLTGKNMLVLWCRKAP